MNVELERPAQAGFRQVQAAHRGMRSSSMSQRLYVGNLPYETSEPDLEALFAQAGAVKEVRMVRDQTTGRARGFAFVEMESEAEAQKAIDQLHDHEFGGRTLQVNEARPRATSGGFGRDGGGGGGRGPRREPRW
jgi:RNA recognition motif-containing protein